MALKTLMIRAKLDSAQRERDALQEQDEIFAAREAELTNDIGEAQTKEERETVEAAVEKFDSEHAAHEAAKAELLNKISGYQAELETIEAQTPPAPAQAAAEPNKERMIPAMTSIPATLNIRALPMNQRAFDALPMEQRQAIVAQDDVQKFFAQLRNFAKVNAAVSGADLTIPVIFLDIINENRYRYSKLMNRVRVRNVNGEARQTIGGIVPEAVWTECCGNLNELTFAFNQITMGCYKVAGFVLICNSLLQDSDLNLAAELIEMISEAIGKAKDKAILYGKGGAFNMPMGVVTRLAQTAQPANYPVNAPAWVDLHTSNIVSIAANLTGAAFWAALRVATGNTYTEYSRGELSWCMNSKTYALLESKAIATTVTGEWVAMIGGRLPIVTGDIDILEFLPDGDIVGGYFDLYLWAQRQGMELGTDMNGFTLRVTDNTLFWGKERADGQPIIAGAFVAINIIGQQPATSMLFAADTANTLSNLLLPAAASVPVGGVITLKPLALPVGIEAQITYASGTPAKATVDANGNVTGVEAGTSVITATSGEFTASITVTVTGE